MIIFRRILFINGIWIRMWDRSKYCYEMYLPQFGYDVNHELELIYDTNTYEMSCDREIGSVELWCLSLNKHYSRGIHMSIKVI